MAILSSAISIAMKDPTNTVGKSLGIGVKALTPTGVIGEGLSKASSIYWRNALLINRKGSPMRKDMRDPKEVESSKIKKISKLPSSDTQGTKVNIERPRKYSANVVKKIARIYDQKDDIKTGNKVIIYNLSISPYQYIVLQNRPVEIENQSQTYWAEIKSMGRNTPMYHYLGGEDEIHFNTSWFVDDPEHPEEVLVKCRLLESWTKSNGYSFAPPLLMIQWGNSDLFKDQLFILTSATYVLSNFSAKCFGLNDTPANTAEANGDVPPELIDYGKVIDGGLLPRNATQELIFKRVSGHNLTSQDYVKDIVGINGIDYKTKKSQSQSIV